jgi:uncharacterized membrane protein YdbT with pleckstrin-like domain
VPAGAAIYVPAPADPAYARYLAEGEIVILALKPSLWFVLVKRASAFGTLVGLWILLAAAHSFGWVSVPLYPITLVCIIAAVIVLTWFAIDRLCRLYLLTDKRVLRISGILNRTTVEIPLHKVTTVVLHRGVLERVLGLGSILFTSAAAGNGAAGGDLVWYIIDRPVAVVKTVRDTLSRYGSPPSGPACGGGDRPFGAAT